jgi:hypothetical protein
MVRKLRDRDTFPGAHEPGDEGGPEPEPAPPRPDGYRYERPHIADSAVHRLLAGLGATRFPRSTTLPQTDGHLAAHYDVGPRPLPPPVPTPMPLPNVLVSTTDPGAGPTIPQGMDETIAIPKQRPPWAAVVVVLVAAVGTTTAVLEVTQGHARRRVPTEVVATASSAPASPDPSAASAAGLPSASPPLVPLPAVAPPPATLTAEVARATPTPPRSAPKPVLAPAVQRRAVKEPEVPRSSETFREE